MPAHRLRGEVEGVEHPPFPAHVPGQHGLPGREPAQVGHPDLDDEAAAGFEVIRGGAEAGRLGVLGGQVHDRVEDQVHQRERAVDPGGGEVADGDADGVAAGLGAQPGHHGPGQVDAVHRDAAAGQRQRDAPGPDAQFQRPALAGQPGQRVGDRVHGTGAEHVR